MDSLTREFPSCQKTMLFGIPSLLLLFIATFYDLSHLLAIFAFSDISFQVLWNDHFICFEAFLILLPFYLPMLALQAFWRTPWERQVGPCSSLCPSEAFVRQVQHFCIQMLFNEYPEVFSWQWASWQPILYQVYYLVTWCSNLHADALFWSVLSIVCAMPSMSTMRLIRY